MNKTGKKHGKKKSGMLLLAGLLGVGAYLVYSEKKASAATSAPVLGGGGGTVLSPNNHPATTPSVVVTGTPGGTSVNSNGQYPITAIVITHTDPLNIRNGPSLQAAVVGESGPPGSTLFIEGPPVMGDGSQNGGWAPVLTPDGVSGFASMVYLNAGQ